MLSQNDTIDGWRTLSVVGWTVMGFGTEVPYGWLHVPGRSWWCGRRGELDEHAAIPR